MGLIEIMEALAAQLDSELASKIPDLQVTGFMNTNPTPPSLDVFPAEPFQTKLGFGPGNSDVNLIVRAMVNTPDPEGAQELLLSMMDPTAETSVEAAIDSDQTLGGKVGQAHCPDGPSNFGQYVHPSGQGQVLSVGWRVQVIP